MEQGLLTPLLSVIDTSNHDQQGKLIVTKEAVEMTILVVQRLGKLW